MGTTGTIMGVSKYLKEMNPDIQIVGLQPSDGSSIAGIRRWPEEYLPTIFDRSRIDRIIDIPQIEAERTMRKLAQKKVSVPVHLLAVQFGHPSSLQKKIRMQ